MSSDFSPMPEGDSLHPTFASATPETGTVVLTQPWKAFLNHVPDERQAKAQCKENGAFRFRTELDDKSGG